MTLPAIVHWEFNHFIVIERWSSKFVDVVDPASGRKRMTAKEFDEGFTGVVIMMEPGVQFLRVNKTSRLNLKSYAKNYIHQAPLALDTGTWGISSLTDTWTYLPSPFHNCHRRPGPYERK